MSYRLTVALALLVVTLSHLLPSSAAHAHARNQSYVYFDVSDGSLSGRIEVNFGDLSKVLDVDADGDGTVTEADVLARQDEIYYYFLNERLVLESGTELLQLVPTKIEFLNVDWDTFALIRFDVPALTRVPDAIEVTYDFLFNDAEPYHLGFAILTSNTRTGLEDNEANFALAFLSGVERQTLSLVAAPWPELLWTFVKAGFHHIKTGLDHRLLFVMLGVAAVFRRQEETLVPNEDTVSVVQTALLVGFFATGAQGLAALVSIFGVVQVPAQLSLGLSAASISVAALVLVFPRLFNGLLVLAVLFGALHGLSYAHFLQPIDIEPNRKLLTVLGFTLGSGLGMIMITGVTAASAYVAFRYVFFHGALVRLGAVGVAVLAAIWAEERVFDLLGPLAPQLLSAVGL